ncbi:type II toxin-antitoxin system Phd/YefM family antitoxin [Falsiroseomonas sp. E2-1-a4]|uniref:type II toxin-antitoxin system Phd/YefM family antitoxin n=1 Tax=Falsiroseomonas sp. E2-1-a4 TaxID=3239299 RepID=UPI003F358E13
MDGTIEARPELSDLLHRVRRGETLTITEGGRPVATLAPAESLPPKRSEAEIARIMDEMRDFRVRHSLVGIAWHELRDEGRR